MNGFEVRAWKRGRPKIAAVMLCAVLGTTVAAAAEPQERVMGGVCLPAQRLHQPRSEALDIAEGYLTGLGFRFERDVKLKLTNSAGQTIDFVADGWDASKKFAYEFTDYYEDRGDPGELSMTEISRISNDTFGGCRILVFEAGIGFAISNRIGNYISGHTNG